MSMRTIARSSSKRNSASDFSQLVFTHTRGSQKQEGTSRTIRIRQPRTQRRTASDTARTASFSPMSRLPNLGFHVQACLSQFEGAYPWESGPCLITSAISAGPTFSAITAFTALSFLTFSLRSASAI